MKGYIENTYGNRIAEIYDDFYPDTEATALDLLEELSAGGPALELGIGTGRVALPLAARGVQISGLDVSESMLHKLEAKPGGENIQIHVGDFVEFNLGYKYKLIYVPFNTFFAPGTQEEQISCMQSAARHLEKDGRFLIEVFVPHLSNFDRGQRVALVGINDDSVRIDVTRHDVAKQQVTSQHVFLSEEGVKLYPLRLRYAWPSELDVMARLAGLQLEHRWASWDKREFTNESAKHISVYKLI